MKTLVALVITNMAWLAGYAASDTAPHGLTPGTGTQERIVITPNTALPLDFGVQEIGFAMAGKSPSGKHTVIQTDERGYVICSKDAP